ncbi:hypothetical protein ES705_21064 [subsurface metagenome]
MKKINLVFVLVVGFGLFVCACGVVSATTVYVPDDYTKIQWAVDNTSAGNTIINLTMIAKLFSILGLCLGMIGTCFLGKGLLMRNETMREISKTYVGGNLSLKNKLKKDRKDAKSGFIFLGLGFLLQCISQFF